MFFSKIFFFFLLVDQLLQISSAASCGNDIGPTFRPKPVTPYIAQQTTYNLPWSVEIICIDKPRPKVQTYGAVISEKHIVGINKKRLCDDKYMKMRFRTNLLKISYYINARPIKSMKPIEDAYNLVLITLKDEYKYESRNTTVCLPTKEDSITDFQGQFIYSRFENMHFRSTIDSQKDCSEFISAENFFCASFSKAKLDSYVKNGVAGTVERDGRHVLVGLAFRTTNKAQTIFYHDIVKYVEAIRKQMAEDVAKPGEPSTSAEDPKSAGGKPSSIYEVVNKNANK